MCRTQRVSNYIKGFWRARGRILLVALTIWALAMVVPELYRLVHPLGSFGFTANGDGVVTDVQGPFPDETASPAWQAGLRRGDRLDLTQMRCIPVNTRRCAAALATFGGLQLVEDHRRVELPIMATEDKPARQIAISPRRALHVVGDGSPAARSDRRHFCRSGCRVARLDAAGANDLGFFPLRHLVQSRPVLPILCVAANRACRLAGAEPGRRHAQGAGLAGFLLFALRAPQDKSTPRWRPIERALPAVAIVLAIVLALAGANVFGVPTEAVTRAGILVDSP